MLVFRWTATAIFVGTFPLFLLLSNVRIAAMEQRVYEYSFDHYDVVTRTGIDRVQLNQAASGIINYFHDNEALLSIRVTVDGHEKSLFNPREVIHMKDVKQLFQYAFRLHEALFVYVSAYVAAVFLWSRERSMRHLASQCIAAGIATIMLMLVAASGLLIGFDELFRYFHILSFSNDLWLLNPRTDHLIQMFPSDFWFDVSLATGIITLFEGVLIALFGIGYLMLRARIV